MWGRGPDGTVLRGEHRAIGTWHALKFVEAAENANVDREIAVLRNFDHPNIAKLLQAFPPHGGRSACVLAFAAADTDLYAFMRKRGGRISEQVAQRFSWQLALGLLHVHGKGFVHRDLKPANVLVTADDAGRATLQVADFSRARELPGRFRRRFRGKTVVDNTGCKLNTREQGLTPGICTLWYCAPELLCCPDRDDRVVEAAGRYGTAVDIWSFGCIVFELLAAEYLACGGSDAGMVAAWIRRAGEPAPELNLGCRHEQLITAARGKLSHKRCVLPLRQLINDGPAGSVALATLQWDPDQRPEITKLLRAFPWLSDAARKSDVALATSQGQLETPQRTQVQSPVPTTKSPCKCSGHCYTPGHNYRRGCACMEVLEGSQYCIDCVCSTPGCLKPRYHGKCCYRHGQFLKSLPLALRAVEASGTASTDLVCTDILSFMRRDNGEPWQDLAFALVASTLDEPLATQVLHQGMAGLPGDGNYSAAEFGKILEAVAATGMMHAQQGVDNIKGRGPECY